MKEINLNGAIFYEYDNDNIYRNIKFQRRLYLISFIFAIITAVIDVVTNTVNNAWVLSWEKYFLYFIYLLVAPFSLFLTYCNKYAKRPSELSDVEIKKISKVLKPSKKKLTQFPLVSSVFASLLPVFMELIFCLLLGDNLRISLYILGYWFPTYIFIYIATALSITNCVLRKKEWEVTPPQTVREAQVEIAEQQMKTKYEKLIEKCGVRFFIKYYKQIKCLPLRDVMISENYTPNERNERICSAKKIIDLGLTKFALNEILNTYRNILEEAEIKQAENLLKELSENIETENPVQPEPEQVLDENDPYNE